MVSWRLPHVVVKSSSGRVVDCWVLIVDRLGVLRGGIVLLTVVSCSSVVHIHQAEWCGVIYSLYQVILLGRMLSLQGETLCASPYFGCQVCQPVTQYSIDRLIGDSPDRSFRRSDVRLRILFACRFEPRRRKWCRRGDVQASPNRSHHSLGQILACGIAASVPCNPIAYRCSRAAAM
jgi:hypothetical protein